MTLDWYPTPKSTQALSTKHDWVVPEKIHTPPPPPPTDGILEILAGGGVKDPGNPGRRGVKLHVEKVSCRGHFYR